MKTSRDKRGTEGFTLIELLIVVAIIAILAAIAVPNFLEAQIRAKVSRVHNDMASMATALEAYCVDHISHMIGISHGERLNLWNRAQVTTDMRIMYFRLTTPIAYMTSVPEDPFTPPGGITTEASDGSKIRPYRGYWYWNYDYPNNSNASKQIVGNGFQWVLRSWGPWRSGGSPWEAAILRYMLAENIYDPTNGTKSRGFIMRTNKGIYKGGA